VDPIGLAGGLNAYGFANGDPVNYSDPFGLTCSLAGHCTQSDVSDQRDHMVSIVKVQGQHGNTAGHVVVSVDGGSQVGFNAAQSLSFGEIATQGLGFGDGVPGTMLARSSAVGTVDSVGIPVFASQALGAKDLIDKRTQNPGNYHLTNRSCVQFGSAVAGAAGLSSGNGAVLPSVLMNRLHQEQVAGPSQ
jgi:hypothetical protein